MKKVFCITLLFVISISLLGQVKKCKKENDVKLLTHQDTLSYAIGTDVGEEFIKNQIEVNFDALIIGFYDVLNGKSLLISDSLKNIYIINFYKNLKIKQQTVGSKTDTCKAKEKAFREKNRKKSDFKMLTSLDTMSYIMGTDVGGHFRKNQTEVNSDAFNKGINDALKREGYLIPDSLRNFLIKKNLVDLQTRRETLKTKKAEVNKVKGKAFLKENRKKDSIIETASGLQYKVLRKGKGKNPKDRSKVTVNNEGRLIDGTIFFSSYAHGQTASFGLNQVIQGWAEGLQLMKKGSIFELYIPSDLGYGDAGYPPDIPPGSTLIFKIELIKVSSRFKQVKADRTPPAIIEESVNPRQKTDSVQSEQQNVAEKKKSDSIARINAARVRTISDSLSKEKVAAWDRLPIVFTDTTLGLNLQMVKIEGGTFLMGSPTYETDREYDEVQHNITLSGFYIGKYEVTQKQWRIVMGRVHKGSVNKDCDSCPVDRINWDDTQKFISILNTITGMTYRLPTEAQWEYACRAGTTTPFYTGDCLTTGQANINGYSPYGNCSMGDFEGNTLPVGSFPPNAWGIYDMYGNMWEWCSDWYDNYESGHQTDPQGPADGFARVVRGGCWFSYADGCRSAERSYSIANLYRAYTPGNRHGNNGFRLVLVP